MCFYLHRALPEPQIATRSIRVWKRFNKKNLKSPYRGFQYERDKEYSLSTDLTEKYDFRMDVRIITDGFHAYTSRQKAENHRGLIETVIECTVPKGSVYYWNPVRQEIVSNRIRISAIKRTRPARSYVSFPLVDINKLTIK